MAPSNEIRTTAVHGVVAVLAVLQSGSIARAGGCGTTVSPGVHFSETWTLAGSPYCVTGDIQLSLITIEPGVRVEVDGPYEIEVLAGLTAVGTASEPIVFTEKDPDDDWHGLKFQNVAPGSQLVYCTVENSRGSGVRIIDSAPVIDHCIIRNNGAFVGVVHGGGMNIDISSGDLVVTDTILEGNEADQNGGGIFAMMGSGTLMMTGCEFRSNAANLEANAGSYSGGGLWIDGGLMLAGCTIELNFCRASGNGGTGSPDRYALGGGIYIAGSGGSVADVRSCVIRNNSCTATGSFFEASFARGANLYCAGGTTQVENGIVACGVLSAGSESGGGIYLSSGATSLAIQNCTIARNEHHGLVNTGGATATVDSSILFFNNNDNDQVSGTVSIDYSDVQNGAAGTDNINYNPVFQGDCCSAWDLCLIPGSPCIDAGNPAADHNDACYPPSWAITDPDRNDMGATGGPGACDLVIIDPADLNEDGVVNVVDLLSMLAAWGPCAGPCQADTNCDDEISVLDLLFLLAHWG